jgi:hypothetical protein
MTQRRPIDLSDEPTRQAREQRCRRGRLAAHRDWAHMEEAEFAFIADAQSIPETEPADTTCAP